MIKVSEKTPKEQLIGSKKERIKRLVDEACRQNQFGQICEQQSQNGSLADYSSVANAKSSLNKSLIYEKDIRELEDYLGAHYRGDNVHDHSYLRLCKTINERIILSKYANAYVGVINAFETCHSEAVSEAFISSFIAHRFTLKRRSFYEDK